ncbi:PREDICTED: protein-S-isoprenylcysteine O-methyltransferase [Ceratosolen solmsi marchali]|uniref:Protein-S-isoprenylcysteine O-methyltransferase n=1 Tax=Ceratosolen solmsi marchali TaxID=326594 RepID=A0AAJ6YDH0_9HYME|nr:PREDICTED: protein-S-isoprenylcysteine O-methyltransferase [Ceratosolen solmsi marchali]
MYYYGFVALITFVISVLCDSLSIVLWYNWYSNIISYTWINIIIYGILCLFFKIIHNSPTYDVTVRALFLGQSFSSGIILYITGSQSWKLFGIYAAVLSTFHFTEFLAIAFTNPKVLSSDTFVINHSFEYTLAATASWAEFLLERYYFTKIKESRWIMLLGLLFCLIGEIFRKTAILTAKHNFNHIIQNKKTIDHKLITHGVYRMCRHPSYVGWFYWSVGTQLILQNPLCLITYALISWKFFHDRILIEEINLIEFFGFSYIQYQDKVGTGLPFILGCKR